jgi:hypothetical protein
MKRVFFGPAAVILAAAAALAVPIAATASAQPTEPLTQISHVEAASSTQAVGEWGRSTGNVAGVAAAPSVDANVTIHLTNSSTLCADVKNDNNNAGAAIWLYSCAQGKSVHWNTISGRQCGTSGQFICSVFVDAKNTSICLGLNAARNAVLQNCGPDGINAPYQSQWIVDTGPENGWRSFAWGGLGDLVVASNKQGDLLYGTDVTAGCGGCWYHWSD